MIEIGRAENELVNFMAYACMFVMILATVMAENFFDIYKALIGFMFCLILIYLSKRVIFIERRKPREKKKGGPEK